MKLYKNPARKKWNEIVQRPVIPQARLGKTVNNILEEVALRKDKAIQHYNKQFDGVECDLKVTKKEMNDAANKVSQSLKGAIMQAKRNIETFHIQQKEVTRKVETMPGVFCWRSVAAIEKVGLYIPGGSAPLFSTILMLAVPAKIAGCKEIIICTPPAKDGSIHPAILYTASLCGVTKILKVGGAQAIAAMAHGTESIPKVFKIFGPGNQYVTAAKQIIQQTGTAIDMPAGPSELLVIADDTAVPEYVAADLLSQAEHGSDSQVMLLTNSIQLAEKVKKELSLQLNLLPRKSLASVALENSRIVIMRNLDDAVELSNLYAPEHLVISCRNAFRIAARITSAGSVFLGNYSPESACDYASGTNHVLPTNGYAAMYSGVSLDSFVKKISFQQLTRKGLQNIGNAIIEMASAEGLEAHKKAVEVRLK